MSMHQARNVVCAACQGTAITVRSADRVHRYKSDENGGSEKTWCYELLECGSCGLGFVNPMPDPATLASFYSRDYGSYKVQDEEVGTIGRSKEITARLRMKGAISAAGPTAIWSRLAGWTIEKVSGRTVPATLGVPLQLPKDAAILDLGFGSGDWLVSMHRLGYKNLYGYDIETNEAHVSRLEQLGVRLSSGDFMENDYPVQGLDCIRMSHVLEHLVNPIEVLEKCRRMLKPGGTVVLSHPCFKSWMAVIGFEQSLIIQLPVHLWHHTPRSTALFLKHAGFVPRQSKSYGVGQMYSDTIDKTRRANHKPPLPKIYYALTTQPYLAFCKLTGRGDFISAYGQTSAVD